MSEGKLPGTLDRRGLLLGGAAFIAGCSSGGSDEGDGSSGGSGGAAGADAGQAGAGGGTTVVDAGPAGSGGGTGGDDAGPAGSGGGTAGADGGAGPDSGLAAWHLPATINVPQDGFVGVRQYLGNGEGATITVDGLPAGVTYNAGLERLEGASTGTGSATATFTADGVSDTATVSLYEPDTIHDFTGLPLTADGWTDLDAMMLSDDYASSRFVFVDPNGAGGQIYTQAQVLALGGTPTNPTTAPNAYTTLSEAYAQMRAGQADVLLVRRNRTVSVSLFVDRNGEAKTRPAIYATYGPLSDPRPTAFVSGNSDAAQYILVSSLRTTVGSGGIFIRGRDALYEDMLYQGTLGNGGDTILRPLEFQSAIRRCTFADIAVFCGHGGGIGSGRIEQCTISRSGPGGYSNVYFAETATPIESLDCQSILTNNAGWRQRGGGKVINILITGAREGLGWGGGFDVHRGIELRGCVSMNVPGPDNFSAPQSGVWADSIFFRYMNVHTGATGFGGWRVTANYNDNVYPAPAVTGATVYEDNIIYNAPTGGIMSYTSGNPGDALIGNMHTAATIQFRNNDIIKTNGGQVLNATSDDQLIWGPGNRYYSSDATSNWFSGRTYGYMVPNTGEALDTLSGLYPNPNRSLQTYMQSIGANPSSELEAHTWYLDGVPGSPSLAGAHANRRGAWDERFTARAVINYIRAGFGKGSI